MRSPGGDPPLWEPRTETELVTLRCQPPGAGDRISLQWHLFGDGCSSMEGSLQASVPLRVLIEKRMRTVISSGLGVYPAHGDFTKVFVTAVTKKKGLRGEQVDELLEASYTVSVATVHGSDLSRADWVDIDDFGSF